MQFEFATATRIICGAGRLRGLGEIAKQFGRRALIVTGKSANRAGPLLSELNASRVEFSTFAVAGEPTVELVTEGARRLRAERCDLVIAMGGGSVIDAGKAVAALAANDGDLLDYLEVVGRGKTLSRPSIPFIAIPTTAGTGAEVTRNAVLASPEHRVKVSLRSPSMFPQVALVDPELTYDLPPELTASTGLDALTQLIEPYVSIRANPMTDALCLDGQKRVARSLRRVFEHGDDASARADMALASLFGGMALANAGLGAVHGFAAPIGGMFPAPHGAVCAALLPHAMGANIRAMGERMRENESLRRYETIAQILTGNVRATIDDGIQWVRDLCGELKIPGLREYGVTPGDFPLLVEKATQASSMKSNPVLLTATEMTDMLSRAL